MVQPHDLGQVIDAHPFFRGIDAKLRSLLVGCAANERFEPGEFLIREGRPADKFFLLRAGHVAVQVDVPGRAPITLDTIGEGEVLGWSWVVEPYISTFDARAMTLVRATSFDGACLRGKMDADPALGYEVLRRFIPIIGHRLASTRLQLLDLYGPKVAKSARSSRKNHQ